MQNDINNAVSLNENLKSNKSSTPKTFSNLPRNSNDVEGYTVKKHVLKPGETLNDLAILYKTDWQSIQTANGIEDIHELKPGQTILIPIKKKDLE